MYGVYCRYKNNPRWVLGSVVLLPWNDKHRPPTKSKELVFSLTKQRKAKVGMYPLISQIYCQVGLLGSGKSRTGTGPAASQPRWQALAGWGMHVKLR